MTRSIELLAVGETMAMVAPLVDGRLVDAGSFRLDAGGAESNVATHVAALGVGAAWFSRLGDDALGRRISRLLGARGVDLSSVVTDPDHPTGLYVKDPGHGVVYYRTGSAASWLSPSDVERVPLDGVRILHLSGITAAISASAHGFLERLIDVAREAGTIVSFDVNHRAALWGVSRASTVLDALVRRADLVFVGRDEAEVLWGSATASAVRQRFAETTELVVKDGAVGATAFTAEGEVFEPAELVEVVDEVGAGDAFAGGYLAARLRGAAVDARLRAGHERAALTLGTIGDWVEERMER